MMSLETCDGSGGAELSRPAALAVEGTASVPSVVYTASSTAHDIRTADVRVPRNVHR